MHLPTADLHAPTAARRLTRDLPRDQALGLRLIALARAAAAMHMGHATLGTNRASSDAHAHDTVADPAAHPDRAQLLRSGQAAALMALLNPTGGSGLSPRSSAPSEFPSVE